MKNTFVIPNELIYHKMKLLKSVQTNGLNLQYGSPALINDFEIVTEAVKHDPEALHYASEFLKGNESIVMEAVCKKGETIRYASGYLKMDKTIVMAG
jgi:hypothetical protein